MAEYSRKLALIAQLDRARHEISMNVGDLSRDLEVGRRVKASFRQHAFAWMGGAGVAGLLVSRLFGRKKKVVVVPRKSRKGGDAEEKVVKAGLLVTMLKIAFDLARPTLTKWATRKVTAYAEQRFAGR